MKGGSRVVVEPHRHEGVFVAKGKEDALCTKNLVTGESVYGEKRIAVQVKRSSSYSAFCSLTLFSMNILSCTLHSISHDER